MLRKILQPFYTAWVLILFLAGLFAGFPFFVLISLGNNATARKTLYVLVKGWATLWLWGAGMPIRRSGPRPLRGKYVIVANHISYLDTVVLFPSLPGYFRALGKKEMSKIPFFGFLYRQLVIMVDRSSDHSRAKSMKLMWRVLKHECNIIIFPEGTFNETGAPLKSFYSGAFRLAIMAQADILPVVFPDTADRWHYSAWWKIWPGRNRVVYLPPVRTTGLKLDDMPQLSQTVHDMMAEAITAARTG